jgi:hypothetical protein
VSIDGVALGEFQAQDTGDFGFGWNVFRSSGPIGSRILAPGQHTVVVSFTGGDGFGVEIDAVTLTPRPVRRPLEVGTATVYGVGSSIVHTPAEALAALWESQRLGLLHPRFGFADAFNLDIADAAIPGCVHSGDSRILRASGRWANFTGFAIDHGPMLTLIDNYLEHQFVPNLFMAYPPVRGALLRLFPGSVPRVQRVTIDDGTAQRSSISRITAAFDSVVRLDPRAITLLRQGGGPVSLNTSEDNSSGRTVLTITFTGTDIVGGSLADGRYTLTISSSLVRTFQGQELDGDGNGTPGGNRVDNFFRLFGDSDGDADVDYLDFFRFRGALGRSRGDAAYRAFFDYDGDGDVDNLDFLQVRRRLGATI